MVLSYSNFYCMWALDYQAIQRASLPHAQVGMWLCCGSIGHTIFFSKGTWKDSKSFKRVPLRNIRFVGC